MTGEQENMCGVFVEKACALVKDRGLEASVSDSGWRLTVGDKPGNWSITRDLNLDDVRRPAEDVLAEMLGDLMEE